MPTIVSARRRGPGRRSGAADDRGLRLVARHARQPAHRPRSRNCVPALSSQLGGWRSSATSAAPRSPGCTAGWPRPRWPTGWRRAVRRPAHRRRCPALRTCGPEQAARLRAARAARIGRCEFTVRLRAGALPTMSRDCRQPRRPSSARSSRAKPRQFGRISARRPAPAGSAPSAACRPAARRRARRSGCRPPDGPSPAASAGWRSRCAA